MLIRPLLPASQCLVAGGIGDGEVAFIVIPTGLGKMPTTSVRRRISRFSRSCGLLDHSFCQWATGKAVKAGCPARRPPAARPPGQRAPGVVPPLGPVGRGPRRETVAGRWCVPCHARLGTLGPGEQVGHEVGAAALPAGSSKDCGDGVLQPLVSIGGCQFHPAEPSSRQRPQEGQPERAVLAGTHVDLTLPFGIDPRRTTTQTFTMRPPSRTFWVRPSSQT